MADTLFPVVPSEPGGAPAPGTPRVQFAVRNQVEIHMSDLDGLVEDNHTVRVIWAYLLKADLAEMYDQIQAVEGGARRPAIDPRILLALWMYAIADGIVPTGLSVQTSLNPAMNCRATVGMSLRDATTNNHW